jgi:hypothetical protein
MRKLTPAVFTAALALVPAAPISAAAQSLWLEPYSDPVIYVEILKPSFESVDLTLLSSVWFLSGRLSVSDDLVLVAEIPLAFAEPDLDVQPLGPTVETEMEGALGNVYVGLDWRPASPEFFGELGVRLPLLDETDLASAVGFFTDFVDRFEAFSSDLVALQVAGNYMRHYPSGFALRLRFSPILDFFTDAEETEVYFHYSGQGRYEAEGLALGGGLAGRWAVTSENAVENLSGTTIHHAALFGSYEIGRFRPGMQVRIPIDEDLRDFIDLTVGLTLGIRLD